MGLRDMPLGPWGLFVNELWNHGLSLFPFGLWLMRSSVLLSHGLLPGHAALLQASSNRANGSRAAFKTEPGQSFSLMLTISDISLQ